MLLFAIRLVETSSPGTGISSDIDCALTVVIATLLIVDVFSRADADFHFFYFRQNGRLGLRKVQCACADM